MDARNKTSTSATGATVSYLHSYDSSRRWRDFNACGQAAVATLLDYHDLNPYGLEKSIYDPGDGRHHWENDLVIDRIRAEFPPDYFGGLFGTTPGRLAEALTAAGLQATASWSSDPAEGLRIWRKAKEWICAGFPVIAIVDRGKLGGRPFAAHWAVVYRVADSVTRLACTKNVAAVSEDQFLKAFACGFMPSTFNHATVFCRPAYGAQLCIAAGLEPGNSNR